MIATSSEPVIHEPDPRLRRPARAVENPDGEIQRLVEELFATMRATRGLGLAAPQIGVDLQVAVVEAEGSTLVLINPEITDPRGVQIGWEGCLSVPHLVAQISRPAKLIVTGIDLEGRRIRYRRDGLAARAIAHEVDHLAGRLFVDLVTADDLVDVRIHPTPPAERASQ